MISEYEKRKYEEEMREFCQGSRIIPDGIDPNFMSRGRIKVIKREKEGKRREKVSVVASITRIINNFLGG